MSPGITFRCTCEHCGAIFFGPDRKATACLKCAKRYRLRVETQPRSTSEPEDDLFAAALAAPTSGAGASRRRRELSAEDEEALAARRSDARARSRGSSVPERAPAAAPSPRATELTDALREEIRKALAEYEGREDVPLRRVHAEVAEKVGASRSLVARVVAETRAPAAALDDDLRGEIVSRYREFVRRMERPAAGRRTTIARDLGIGRQQVVGVVREWAAMQPSITDLSREALFRIERAYNEAVDRGEPFEGLAGRIAQDLGFTEWQVERWLDVLHDGDFRDVEEVPPDQYEAVVAAYQEYLQGDGPPPRSLHVIVGERLGLTPRQVHKVLVEYRLDRRRAAFGF
ncbi:MAG: hypothetical protein QHJ73_00965 [Armatimonadota bacterium]|nr:hypothetical protein [Armatimonadota bacterium]